MEVYGTRPKFGTKEWFTNYFWYHYKWPTLITLLIAALLAILIWDSATQEKYDMEISFNTVYYVDSDQEQRMRDILNMYAEDLDDNGYVSVSLFANVIPQEGGEVEAQMVMGAQTKFYADMSEGKAMVLIMDEILYDQLMEGNEDVKLLADLSSITDKAYDGGTKVKLSDTPLADDPMLEPIVDGLFICLRAEDSHLVTKNEESMLRYQQEKEMLANLLNDRKTVQ